ncbi:MAG: tRNA preQ1(34) S-adenosylmethionine ribosyltransferase-isomerase QueA [Anaerolineales bacterium]|nr:tRNA preQ1(34) S-adenosylmethionine ribosyltransferase-isomerase QueA [Anaerolineales bacterium]
MRTSDFDYTLPPECIAQHPAEPRDSSRLLVLDRSTSRVTHRHFRDILSEIAPPDVLVLNETRVIPARLKGKKIPGGGKVEVLLLKRTSDQAWEALVGGRGLKPGRRIHITESVEAEIVEDLGRSKRIVRFSSPISTQLDAIGDMPLPPYIHAPLQSRDQYQTTFARNPGSAAAPTAGLHFTPELLRQIEDSGIRILKVTLHVGLDTFLPVSEDDPADHVIHTEWCSISSETALAANAARRQGGRVIGVGTTSVRTLETGANVNPDDGLIASFEGPTSIFILPGYSFKGVDAIITNFHLPRSSLIMMVSAFAGRERILATYQQAVEAGYRFYSFGDAMFIR